MYSLLIHRKQGKYFMKHSVRKEPLIELGTVGEKKSYSSTVWRLCLTVLMVLGNTIAFVKMWGTLSPGMIKTGLAALLMIAWMAVVEYLKKKSPYFGIAQLIPWILFFGIAGWRNVYTGMKGWVNLLISRWNQIHEGGAGIFQVQISDADIQAFSIGMCLLIGLAGYLMIKGHHTMICFLYELVWFYLLLLVENFDSLAGGLMFAAFLGLFISTKQQEMTKRGFLWLAVVVVIFCIGSGAMNQTEIKGIHNFREDIQTRIHTMRYGKDVLPEGELRAASELKSSEEGMLTVKTEQEKNLYLRGFVGGTYQNGRWRTLSDAAYGGDNSGMLKWLKQQKFDPLYQNTEYLNLGDDAEQNPENQVQVTVTGASRYYVYAPTSLLSVTEGRLKEKSDTRLMSRGFFGEKKYAYEEESGTRPAELTVTDSWVGNPRTGKQKRYSKAEAAYRNFVYDQYTAVDSDVYELMNKLFWDDYDSENDGIYSALNQVRKKLSETLTYVDQPKAAPEEEDPIIWGLTKAQEGNDVLYASTAVEALRAHGIPARYVEGYYLSADDVKDGGSLVHLTGQDAHAWLEVYFDGVGWQPVDVTPGYYYDAMALRNMVNTPDMEHKSAAIQNQGNTAESSTKLEDAKKSNGAKIPKAVRDTAAIITGILTLVLVLVFLWFALLEIGRVVFAWVEKKTYLSADQKDQVLFMERRLFTALSFIGVQTTLGWNTKEIDELLASRLKGVKPGEYIRASELIERSVYGDVELQPYELRTIQVFLTKVRQSLKDGKNWRAKMMLRYEWIHRKWIHKKQI